MGKSFESRHSIDERIILNLNTDLLKNKGTYEGTWKGTEDSESKIFLGYNML